MVRKAAPVLNTSRGQTFYSLEGRPFGLHVHFLRRWRAVSGVEAGTITIGVLPR